MYDSEAKKTKKITVGRLFKWFGISIIVFIYSCIVVRSLVSCDSKLVEKVIYNETTVKAYEGQEELYVEQYPLNDFWRSIGANQLLMIDNLYYSPVAQQMQVSVKYNTSYAFAPSASRIPFRFYLLDEVGMKYEDYFFKTDLRNGYGYIRVCFEGIELTKQTSAGEERKLYTLFLEKMENEGGVYEPFESFPLYNGSELYKEVEFSFDY